MYLVPHLVVQTVTADLSRMDTLTFKHFLINCGKSKGKKTIYRENISQNTMNN